MPWQFDQLKYAFGLGGIMSFYGIIFFITYMIPAASVGYNQKILIVALVLLTLPFALVIAFVSSRRRKKREKLEAEAAEQASEEGQNEAAEQKKAAAPAGTYPELTTGAEEVVQFLKTSNLGSGGKDAVYSLPWYLIAGADDAGKSALVQSSNLNFQTLPSQRASEQKFIRPTGSVDWRVTSEAVFVDTAGRYQSDGDMDEWSSLVDTIKKYRGNRPLDGFILVVNAKEILNSDEREMEEKAKVLRSRLDDVIQRTKLRFPVYLIFTNADAIEGFRDSFSTSKNEDKTLVWGATIPVEKSENAQSLFDSEFELLHDSVMKRRLLRLSAPFPPVRQLRIFNFPLHFGAARRKFGAFVNALFRPNPFSENPFLRGFYFTAAPSAKSAPNAPPVASSGYFTQRLFRDVILRDKDFVRTMVAQRQRAPIFGWLMTLLGALAVLLLLVMSAVSLISNRQMLDEAKVKGQRVLTIVNADKADPNKTVLNKKPDEVRAELNAADELRGLLSRLDNYERDGAPVYMRFGLYSGNSLYKQQLLPIYMAVIEQRFKAPTLKRVDAELRKFAASQPVANRGQLTDKEEENLGKYYDLLKAYLMLTGDYKQKAEATHIANTLKDYWVSEAKLPPDMNLVAQQQLEFWAKQVDRDDDQYRFPRISPDGKLITDVREKLKDFPPVYRYYKRRVTEISKEIDDQIGKTTAESILARNGADSSFIEGTYSVPSAFTRPGYELMKKAIAETDQKLSEDDWVMGETGKKEIAQATDASKVEDRYYRDYADHWRNFVKGVNVQSYGRTREGAVNALQAFSSANSPMKILLREIAKNTNLSAKPEAEGWIDWTISYVKSWFSSKTASQTGGSQPEKEFRPLFTFVGTKNQKEKTNVDSYQGEIATALKDFNAKVPSTDKLREIAQQMANDEDPLKLRARETAIQGLTSSFNETPAGQEIAALLMKPIGNLRELLGADARSQLLKAWNEQMLPAAKEIEKGYPFEDGQSDADLAKLTAYLNPVDGKFSKFYDDRLKKYFEESNGQLKLKDTAEIKFTDEFVAYLNNAVNLRKALYGTNPTPKFEYEFSFKPAKDALIEITIDGQKITSEGTASIKGTFPAATATQTGVFMNFASTATPAPTSGTANANTAGKAQPNSSGSSLAFPGNWGLFKFVDAGRPQKQAGGEYLLGYSLGGKSISAIIKPSGGDLFDKNIFRSLKVPQNFLK